MDQQLPNEIKTVRDGLARIRERRSLLAQDDFAGRASLLDEEHDLEAQLADLLHRAAREDMSDAGSEAASQTDLSRNQSLTDVDV